jgi:hypothetical protein
MLPLNHAPGAAVAPMGARSAAYIAHHFPCFFTLEFT